MLLDRHQLSKYFTASNIPAAVITSKSDPDANEPLCLFSLLAHWQVRERALGDDILQLGESSVKYEKERASAYLHKD